MAALLAEYESTNKMCVDIIDPPLSTLKVILNDFNEGKFSQVRKKSTEILHKFPNSAWLHNVIGLTHLTEGDAKLAIKKFNDTIHNNKNFAEAYFNRGRALQIVNKIQPAIASYQKAVELQPDYFQAYNNLGNSFKLVGKFEQALDAYKKALELQPNLPQIHNNLGVLYREMGELVTSIAAFRTSISFYPNYSEAHNNLSISLCDYGLLDDAEYHAKEALSGNQNYKQAYNNLGNILSNQGNLKEARASYLKALDFDPVYSDAIWNLHGTASNIHDAIEILKKCTNSDVVSELAKMTLAALEASLGDTRKLSKFYETNPLHPYVRSFRWVLELNNRPKIFFNRWDVFDFAISKTDPTLPFYEFGEWRGVAFRILMKTSRMGTVLTHSMAYLRIGITKSVVHTPATIRYPTYPEVNL